MCMIQKQSRIAGNAGSLSPALLIQPKATAFAQSLATGTQNTRLLDESQAIWQSEAFTAQLGAALTLHRHCLARVEHVAGASNLN